jgi:hypothetical protein
MNFGKNRRYFCIKGRKTALVTIIEGGGITK